jgi:hypothetical protein
LDLLALRLQYLLITINTALSLIYTHSSSLLHTHWDSRSPLVVAWYHISTQELSLKITTKSSCHFIFNYLGMPTQFSDSNCSVSVLHGTNLYSLMSSVCYHWSSLFVSGNAFITLAVNKSSNYTVSLHGLTSTRNFPWLSRS